MKHKFHDLCERAHRNTSFTPDKRAVDACAGFDADAANVLAWGGNPQKHEALFTAWMHAKSRCASPMITGPANYPVARQEKANRAEENHGKAYYEYLEKLERAHTQEAYYLANPHARPIRTDDVDAVERLEAKLEAARAHHTHLKANPAERAHSMSLAYALRDIKEVEGRLRVLQRVKEAPVEEGTRYVVDKEAARVYFVFDGKPDDDTRTLLKSHAFKWTPSRGHWGRMLTDNALRAAREIASKMEA